MKIIDLPLVSMNNLYQEVLDTINNKRLDNMCDISTLYGQIMYRINEKI